MLKIFKVKTQLNFADMFTKCVSVETLRSGVGVITDWFSTGIGAVVSRRCS